MQKYSAFPAAGGAVFATPLRGHLIFPREAWPVDYEAGAACDRSGTGIGRFGKRGYSGRFVRLRFLSKNKKLVTCGALAAADQFCVEAMQSRFATAALCQDNGIIICSNPCTTSPKQIKPDRCAFDGDRPRGNQAPPLDFFARKPSLLTPLNSQRKKPDRNARTAANARPDTASGSHRMTASNISVRANRRRWILPVVNKRAI